MSSPHEIYTIRAWMYNRRDPESGEITNEFKEGLKQFMTHAQNQPVKIGDGNNIFCPCRKCENIKDHDPNTVWKHIYTKGFCPNYFVWFSHGEDLVVNVPGSSSRNAYHGRDQDGPSDDHYGNHQLMDEQNVNYHHQHYNNENEYGYGNRDGNRFHDMVTDAFHETTAAFTDDTVEEPNADAKKFYDMLDAANEPLYEGCREGLSRLSLAARMMTIKSEENESERCMDKWAALIKDILPEGNNAAETYYEIQKLVAALGLPSVMIDVCIDNCMIFWKDDVHLQECRFCGKPRYKETSGRSKVPFHRMWYLPITDRLKRLYQSERTAGAMRWHAEHFGEDGVISHPSDAKAWKHFNTVHSEFSAESRNVYLGLTTDGFSPFGMSGRQYSLWPVIVTPYNLPPGMCMQREFLFLAILVPGPKHPKRSLDVFMQPLIEELQELWHVGVRTFDSSTHRNFNMRAVLMWTISDFPAFGMLSGWTTHGRLSCPYCLDQTNAFQLENGRKPCWFDCHRRFLPASHPYRRNRSHFTNRKVVKLPPPVYQTGEQLETQIEYYGAERTPEVGGQFHTPANMPGGYGQCHNWHKKSIFWELPYWKDHLLRHNLDVMHVEKNFFENIIHTLLNVPGKTKDNLKSRMDLPGICARPDLHLQSDGRAPIPDFRLSGEAKNVLFKWMKEDVKFPDGYVSTFSRCVEQGQKFSGMKSHDCHVFMQRLLPFAMQELLPKNVHEALAGIGAFFRDLCARSLRVADIAELKSNIAVIICNLEKIFPPSFFDVMEHLAIHLPLELELGGPVQFRWMYPVERLFKHVKKYAKNLARVEGSIVAGSLTEETSNFTSYYFSPAVKTRRSSSRSRYDDGGVGRTYPDYGVPADVFSDVGRMGGNVKSTQWCDYKHLEAAHTYIMLNCDYFRPYESELEGQIRDAFPDLVDEEVRTYVERDFAGWMREKVRKRRSRHAWPLWVHEFVAGPVADIRTAKMYCTRGFIFHTFSHGQRRATSNYGIHVPGETNFYGILKEIIEVEYGGLLSLRCVLFRCDWFDPTVGVGVRSSKFGVVDVLQHRRYTAKWEPFILASQAEQVVFIPYPRVRTRRDQNWLAVIKVNPRGRIIEGLPVDEDDELPPVQPDRTEQVSIPVDGSQDFSRIDPVHRGLETICEETDDDTQLEDNEFEEGGEVDPDDVDDDDDNENDHEEAEEEENEYDDE